MFKTARNLHHSENMTTQEKYLPVDPDFIELCELQVSKRTQGKVHFFQNGKVELAEGISNKLISNENGKFILIGTDSVRLDMIITLFGKPGPSYAAYDRFGNVCLTCEDLGQF